LRVLFLCQYVVRPDQPGGVRHWRNARALAEAGHEVTVVTSSVLHSTQSAPAEMAGRRAMHTREDGLDVWRVHATADYGRDVRSRASNHVSFAANAAPVVARVPRPDVVLASSPPLLVGVLGAWTARARRARLVLEVRDLWPESALATGLVTDPRAIRLMGAMADLCYRRADRVIALTEGIAEGVAEHGVNPAAVTLVTNGVDLDPDPDTGAPVDLPDAAFTAMFVGQHGTYSALPTLLDAAERLRSDPGLRIVLVGDGDRKAGLVEEARRRGLDNVTFVDPVPKAAVPSWLAAADACLLTYQDSELFAGALPNKIFDYMNAGRPIIASVPRGEASRAVEAAGCGIVAPPEDGAAVADAVRTLAADREAARRMGEAGRAYARERYDRRELTRRFVSVVESAA
jgi:colanic acid biosynthesis glycosyl transferase WcaI